MAYDADTRIFDSSRTRFLTAGRHNVVHPFCMNHHRLSWGVLRAALNKVLKGDADMKLANSLVAASPAAMTEPLKRFKAAVTQLQAGKALQPSQVAALEAIETEVFSLPCNLFQGLNARYDDPGDKMDFTPDDIDSEGLRTAGDAGKLQKVREQIFGLLSKKRIDEQAVHSAITDWVKLWNVTPNRGLAAAEPHKPAWWARIGPQWVNPAFRHWQSATLGRALTNEEARKLNDVVFTRATTKF